MTDGDHDQHIDFRDSLLNFRQSLTHIEQWWSQGNKEETKNKMLRTSRRLEKAADYFFPEVTAFEEYSGEHIQDDRDGDSSSLFSKASDNEGRETVADAKPKDRGEELPNYLSIDDKIRNQKIELTVSELHSIIYSLDWQKILQEAIEGRPSSWGYPDRPARPKQLEMPVNEWRNASDELIAPVWKQLFQELFDRKSELNTNKNAEDKNPT